MLSSFQGRFAFGKSAPSGPAGPFTPLSLGSSLELWFDAQDTSTLYNDKDQTTLASNGQRVNRWLDKSGNIRHGMPIFGDGYGPYRNDTYIDGKPGVEFQGGWPLMAPWDNNGVSPNYEGADYVPGSLKFEIWCVYKSTDITSVVLSNATSFSDFWQLNTSQGMGHTFYANVASGQNMGIAYTAVGSKVIARCVYDATLPSAGCTIEVNGIAGTPDVAPNNAPLGNVASQTRIVGIGAYPTSFIYYPMTGAVGEIVYVSRHLTGTEATNMSTYLNDKWTLHKG